MERLRQDPHYAHLMLIGAAIGMLALFLYYAEGNLNGYRLQLVTLVAINIVIAVALTSAEPRAGFPLTLELAHTSLPKRTWVKISQIRTISTQRLAGRLASCHPAELQQVIQGLDELIGKP